MDYIVYGIAYLLGAIPFGLIFVRCSGGGDVREIGSGNIGATNVLRTGKKGVALATLLADGGKGALAVFLALRLGADPHITAALAVVGHIFPIWLKFKGGKGVATILGVLLVLNPFVAGLVLITWLIMVGILKMSSLASLVACALAPLYAWGVGEIEDVYLTAVLAALIVWTHRENIGRIIRGEEATIGKGGSEGGI